jgi:hypothetical protein
MMIAAVLSAFALATPAAALSIQVNFPTLTYPPVSTPDTTQGCADTTSISSDICPSPAK